MFFAGQSRQIDGIRCPYDSTHLMPRQSFVRHVDRCKAVNKQDFKQCPYDVYHIILKQQFTKHCENCPSKRQFQESSLSNWDYQDQSSYNSLVDNHKRRQSVQNHILTESLVHSLKTDSQSEESYQVRKALNVLSLQQSEDQDQQWDKTDKYRPNASKFQSSAANNSVIVTRSQRNQQTNEKAYKQHKKMPQKHQSQKAEKSVSDNKSALLKLSAKKDIDATRNCRDQSSAPVVPQFNAFFPQFNGSGQSQADSKQTYHPQLMPQFYQQHNHSIQPLYHLEIIYPLAGSQYPLYNPYFPATFIIKDPYIERKGGFNPLHHLWTQQNFVQNHIYLPNQSIVSPNNYQGVARKQKHKKKKYESDNSSSDKPKEKNREKQKKSKKNKHKQ